MSDVFISYARKDRAWAERLKDALMTYGLDVWWDADLMAGGSFTRVIQDELDKTKSVIVLWSDDSVESKFVGDEASYARDLDKLVPVTIDGAEPPLGFRQIHTQNIEGWKGNADAKAIKRLADSIGNLTETELNTEIEGDVPGWIQLSKEDAQRHPLYGFGGALLVIYIVVLINHILNALNALTTAEQIRATNDIDPFDFVAAEQIANWAGPEKFAAVGLRGTLAQMILFIPFMLLPLSKWQWTPALAAFGLLLGQVLWPIYWLPQLQPVGSYISNQVPIILQTVGVAAFLLISERVRVTYRHQMRMVLI